MVNEAQIYDQSSSAVYRGPLITMHFRGEPQTELLSLLLCVPASSADPYKGIPCTYFNQWAEASPIKLELHSSILICIFTWCHNGQPIRTRYSDQSRQCNLDQSNSANLDPPFV